MDSLAEIIQAVIGSANMAAHVIWEDYLYHRRKSRINTNIDSVFLWQPNLASPGRTRVLNLASLSNILCILILLRHKRDPCICLCFYPIEICIHSKPFFIKLARYNTYYEISDTCLLLFAVTNKYKWCILITFNQESCDKSVINACMAEVVEPSLHERHPLVLNNLSHIHYD